MRKPLINSGAELEFEKPFLKAIKEFCTFFGSDEPLESDGIREIGAAVCFPTIDEQ